MAIPAEVVLSEPYLLIQQDGTTWQVAIGNNSGVCSFGVIDAMYASATKYTVGDRVLYPIPSPNVIVTIDNIQYSLVDENTILLKETAAP